MRFSRRGKRRRRKKYHQVKRQTSRIPERKKTPKEKFLIRKRDLVRNHTKEKRTILANISKECNAISLPHHFKSVIYSISEHRNKERIEGGSRSATLEPLLIYFENVIAMKTYARPRLMYIILKETSKRFVAVVVNFKHD